MVDNMSTYICNSCGAEDANAEHCHGCGSTDTDIVYKKEIICKCLPSGVSLCGNSFNQASIANISVTCPECINKLK